MVRENFEYPHSKQENAPAESSKRLDFSPAQPLPQREADMILPSLLVHVVSRMARMSPLLRTSFSPAHPLARQDAPVALARAFDSLSLYIGSGQGCPFLRASNEHILIVRVLRARRTPGRSLPIPSPAGGLFQLPAKLGGFLFFRPFPTILSDAWGNNPKSLVPPVPCAVGANPSMHRLV